uniref:Threonine aldolase 1 n=1 Tax=Cyprinus carpio TaxID=7962 RepID=A0A8C2BXX6_CYPCA
VHSLTIPARLLRYCFHKPRRVFYVDPVRLYYGSPQVVTGSAVRTVDLRSDTVTKPGAAMRRAMAEAEVGDDVFGEDPTVNVKDNAGYTVSLRTAYVIFNQMLPSITTLQGLAGVHSATVTTLSDGTFDLDQLISKIRHGYPDPHYPRSRLVCVENTHNIQGGRVLPLSFLQELRSVADNFGLTVHMDGARVMNAAVALGVQPSAILQHCHSVSVCLSKGLGAPVGTMLGGSKDFIQRAVRTRKALGGGMRQSGVLAAAGKIALSDMIGRMKEDHRNTKSFAQDVSGFVSSVDLTTVESNILRFRLRDAHMSPAEFCERMAGVDEEEVKALGQGVQVLMFPHVGGTVRAVWHLGISEEDTQLAIQKAHFVAHQHKLKSIRAA